MHNCLFGYLYRISLALLEQYKEVAGSLIGKCDLLCFVCSGLVGLCQEWWLNYWHVRRDLR